MKSSQWKNQKVLIHDSVQYPAEKKEVLRLRLRMTAFMLRNLDSGDEVPSELTALLYRVSFITSHSATKTECVLSSPACFCF